MDDFIHHEAYLKSYLTAISTGSGFFARCSGVSWSVVE